ncbi:hypothetical protein ACFQNF_11445 [Iodobacter arcticus]|uniref:PEGA domain-containing protein n=1 Tax=Iodobacter arcticus TaxID=590593 RepID=A0ABW2QYB2_9NEIS
MKRVLAASIATLLMSGCSTIIEGKTQHLSFNSVPDSAAITISNRAGEKVHVGTTPASVTLKRGAGYFKPEIYTVRIEKEGFKPKDLTITGSVNGWYVGNILFGGLIGFLIVDPITGAMYSLAPDAINTSLEALDVKTSKADGSLTIVLAENVPASAWKNARPINVN